METTVENQFPEDMLSEPKRPDFLKILCILSFIACGLMILVFALGTMSLALDAETVDKFWGKVIESNPQFADEDPLDFFHKFGMFCLYSLIANIFSLAGVIMMWRLERVGFFIYALAELIPNFISIKVGNQENESYVGLIVSLLIDLTFITLYFVNLKHMKKKI